MLASLGLFVFELATFPFSEQTRRRGWKHARTARVGAPDAAQFVGAGDDKITLSGILAPEAVGSYGAIDTLIDMADAGDAYQLVDGTGRVWGAFVIEAIDERRKHLMIDGVPRLIDFAVDLGRVVPHDDRT